MLLLLAGALLWRAPATIELSRGAVERLELPAVSRPARLVFRARLPAFRPSGSLPILDVAVNGTPVAAMRDRRTPRLLNKPLATSTEPFALPWFDAGLWRIAYGPFATARDETVLDVSDLVHADAPNVVTLAHRAAAPVKVVVTDLRLEEADTPPLAPRAPPPDWTTPRLALPAPPAFTATGDAAAVHVAWAGQAIDVRTTVTGGARRWSRELAARPTHVEVRDTITNTSTGTVGLRIRHAVTTGADWIHLGGRADPSVAALYDPWNPTLFTPVAAGGVGLVAEDDVLRQQVVVDWDRTTGTAGLRTDLLCLAPGATTTLVWSIYPTRTGNYWDFLNRVRDDWGVNRTVPGSYVWFLPDDVLAMDPERLRAALARQGVGVASLWGGWVDAKRTDRPPVIGFGTYVTSDAFASYRARIAEAVRRLKAARPGLTVLPYFDAQRDSTPDAPTRFADSLLVEPGGRVERTDWGGTYTPSWGMVPTTDDTFGRALAAVPDAMRALGADGLYWDEMDGVDYGAPRMTTARWDGHTCLLDADGTVRKRVGLVNLLSDEAKLTYARGRFVLGNTPPTTRAFQRGGPVRMVEAQHNSGWSAFTQLSDPLGYIGARTDWQTVVEKLGEGLLVAGTRFDYAYDLPARLFPFTPEYLQPGTLRGRERIVTITSGTHGWPDAGSDAIAAYRYDASGREHVASWHVKRRGAAVLVHVALAPGEAAVLERARVADVSPSAGRERSP